MEPAWLGSRSPRVGFRAALAAASASGLWLFRGMACGATLKRPMEFEAALLSPGSPKRRRCAPLPGPTPGLRPLDAEPPPLQMQMPPASLQQPAPPGSERRLPTPGNLRCCCGLGREPGRGVGERGGGGGRGHRPKSSQHPISALGEKGTGVLLGPVASGDERHPGRAVTPQGRFSGFLELESLRGGHQDEVRIPQTTEGSWCP